jgi:hypothetical protein
MAAFAKPCSQTVELRGFTGTIQAFEGNQESAPHALSLSPKQS